jgi:hypothetical protein
MNDYLFSGMKTDKIDMVFRNVRQKTDIFTWLVYSENSERLTIGP